MPTPKTHFIRFTVDRAGSAPVDWIDQTKVGETLEATAVYLANGELQDHHTLTAVYALDLTPGALGAVDVTADVLRRVAALCEADGNEVPRTVGEAFARHGVPAPFAWVETEFRDHNDEHRLGAADCLSRRAA